MKYKDTKRYLTVTKENVNQFIKYIMTARNVYIDQGIQGFALMIYASFRINDIQRLCR